MILHVLDALSDGIAICDRTWRLKFVNQREANIIGRLPEELLDQVLWDVYPEAKNSACFHELNRVLTEQVAVRFQSFYMSSGYLEVRAYPIPEGILILHQDITPWKQKETELQQTCNVLSQQIAEQVVQLEHTRTELEKQALQRQQAEEALQATNEAFAFLLESITDGFYAVDTQWKFTYINRRAEQLLQKHASELLGRGIWDVYPSLIDSEFYQSCYEAVHQATSLQVETVFPGLDRWFEVTLYPSNRGLSIFFQDITARKHMEQERSKLLQQAQASRSQAEFAHQRCLFLARASQVLASSLNYETTLTNVVQLTVPLLADFCLLHKYEDDGNLHPIVACHSNEYKQSLINGLEPGLVSSRNCSTAMKQVLQTGEPLLISDLSDLELLAHDAQTLNIYHQLAPQSLMIVPLIARGQKFGTLTLAMAESDRQYDMLDLAVAGDLAQRAAIAIDNAHLYQQAQEASRLKDEFLMTLSHELRSPLHAITGWAQMLHHRQLSQRTTEQALEVIEQKAGKLTQLVYDLLSLSRIVTGQLQLRPGLVKLDDIVQETLQSLNLAAAVKRVELVSDIDEELAPIQGDGRYLRQVIWNLVSNAIKFTPPKGHIEISLRPVEQALQLTVRDTGKGISPDILPYIFDPFRQADSSKTRSYEGLGVGLSLTQHLIELHGGTIQAWSEGNGKGATFVVNLPVISHLAIPEASVTTIANSIHEPLLAEESPILEGLRVLLLDDELQQDDLFMQLEQDGAEVMGVASAADGIQILEPFNPHVLVVHLRQTIGPGEVKLLAKTKVFAAERGNCLPAIALTACSSKQRAQALALGFQACLSRQSPAEDLAMMVGAIARQSQDM
ncbi:MULTISPECIES: ATP-binding protein [unclassified Leptolyngbya]|uniref:ATP-binding protein n=1 Tax=unclassified Leptolyngbya TaxID=2650499 RepID=UPI001687FA6B|nr:MULTISPECIES: ATP-binding protein [unclassified Leptolyngbya]MBD1909030.1 PAS domain-containing protein [Leptolyngbya sp. FACHB-8]MBD2153022.1 PAS domain-containing protein [Leptolyngbya sp. FACHB-16]